MFELKSIIELHLCKALKFKAKLCDYMKYGSDGKLFKNGLAIVKESYVVYTECFNEYISIAERYLDYDTFDKELVQHEHDDFELFKFQLNADDWIKQKTKTKTNQRNKYTEYKEIKTDHVQKTNRTIDNIVMNTSNMDLWNIAKGYIQLHSVAIEQENEEFIPPEHYVEGVEKYPLTEECFGRKESNSNPTEKEPDSDTETEFSQHVYPIKQQSSQVVTCTANTDKVQDAYFEMSKEEELYLNDEGESESINLNTPS